MANSNSWEKIFEDCNVLKHDFDKSPFLISAREIQTACQNFTKPNEKEVRLLCKQDTREDRPEIFQQHDLFILPVKNGHYNIIRGEGYVDIPPITGVATAYVSSIDFSMDTVDIGNSEMQHLDYAYATSLIRSFTGDDTLILTIRGRKRTPEFEFHVGKHTIKVSSVQTEVDGGYEGKNKIVLVEAKNLKTANLIIRQLYYPFRQWQQSTTKKVETLFFQKEQDACSIWQFGFEDEYNYNSIELIKAGKFKIQ